MRSPSCAVVSLLLAIGATAADAQVRVPDNVRLELTGRLHAQYNTSSAWARLSLHPPFRVGEWFLSL